MEADWERWFGRGEVREPARERERVRDGLSIMLALRERFPLLPVEKSLSASDPSSLPIYSIPDPPLSVLSVLSVRRRVPASGEASSSLKRRERKYGSPGAASSSSSSSLGVNAK